MTEQRLRPPLDAALMERHRTMWATGDYPRVARELVAPLGPTLVAALDVRPGERVLDVAAGTGNAALSAAGLGARVTASDLTPELIESGRAEHPDVDLEWEVANAEELPYADGSFDVVMSCIGVMFAPHHERAADELLRVCRPGGRVGVLSWTPEGTIGRLFAAMKPFMPPPPPGASPPPRWGDEAHVATLLGDRVERLEHRRGRLAVTAFDSGRDFRDYFATHYGPTIMAYRAHAGDAERTAALDAALVDLGEREGRHSDGRFSMEWEFLVVIAGVL